MYTQISLQIQFSHRACYSTMDKANSIRCALCVCVFRCLKLIPQINSILALFEWISILFANFNWIYCTDSHFHFPFPFKSIFHTLLVYAVHSESVCNGNLQQMPQKCLLAMGGWMGACAHSGCVWLSKWTARQQKHRRTVRGEWEKSWF